MANYSLKLKAETHRSRRIVFKQSNDNWYNLDYINFNASTIFVLQILVQRCSHNHYFNQRWMNRIESLLQSIALKWRIEFNGTFDHELKLQETTACTKIAAGLHKEQKYWMNFQNSNTERRADALQQISPRSMTMKICTKMLRFQRHHEHMRTLYCFVVNAGSEIAGKFKKNAGRSGLHAAIL